MTATADWPAPSGPTTWTALTTLDGEAAARRLAEAVEDALDPTGVGAFEVEDGSERWEVGAYFSAPPDEIALALLAAAHRARPFAVSALADRDWVAQVRRELTPVRAGRVVVHGRHDREAIAANAVGVEIEAAMAFGTGHHGTTAGCLLALDHLMRSGRRPMRAADVGCGTGVLGIAAKRMGARRVVATDLDAVAVAAAAANARANRAGLGFRVGLGPGLRCAAHRAEAPYDLVFANILAKPLKALAQETVAATRPGGAIILSGLLMRQQADVLARYRAWGARLERRFALRGWATLLLTRGRPSRR